MSDASADARRVRVIVRGRVQGVAFRYYTAEQARRAGVAGWVRNRPDGSVEAVFEGAPSAVDGAARVRAPRPALGARRRRRAVRGGAAGDAAFEIRH